MVGSPRQIEDELEQAAVERTMEAERQRPEEEELGDL